MKRTSFFYFIPLFIITLSCMTSEITRIENFVTARNGKFLIGNSPYYFLGTNLWYGAHLGANFQDGHRERLLNELDSLQKIGITNLRILAATEESYLPNTLRPALQEKPGIYNDNLLEGLDFLLDEMSKRKMYAVVYLNNFWEWSGGMSQYNHWFKIGDPVDPYDTTRHWHDFLNYSAQFYKNEEGNKLFKELIKLIITRKNKFNGRYYFEDPTIMSWQLANEPRPGGGIEGEENLTHFYEWIDSTAFYIRSLAPNQLISVGSEGVVGTLMNEEYYHKLHKSKHIDYLTFHLWIKNWGWFNSKDSSSYGEGVLKALEYIETHIRIAKEIQKPLVLEEFGLTRDENEFDASSSTILRDNYYKTIFDRIYESAKRDSIFSGSNFWAWGGEGRSLNKNYFWEKGESFTGDPPHEPQGLYSVFNSDKSTIEIIKDYSLKMNLLNNDFKNKTPQ